MWSPTPDESCRVELASLEKLRQLQPSFEAHGTSVDGDPHTLFRSPELRNYEPIRSLPESLASLVPAEIRRLLGWKEKAPLVPGAYAPGR